MDELPYDRQAVRFRAVLTPNRSLSRAGFIVLLSLVGVANLVMGIAFMVMGAWPVLIFCGLDVALVYFAFRLNYRSGRMTETIEIGRSSLVLMRIHPSGATERYELNPYWARINLAESPDGSNELKFASHGRELTFARFLSNDERRELAAALKGELLAARTATGTT